MSDSVSAAMPKRYREISPARWLIVFLIIVALVAGANFLVAWRMDVFGILREARGRTLVTSDHERKQKYLLSKAYVPENFNALLIGASASVNWRMNTVDGYRFYNESLEGGDATEERKLVEQALPSGHFGAAVVVLYPRLTDLHLLQDGFDQVKQSEALGSLSLLGVEFDVIRQQLTHIPLSSYPDGSHDVPVHAPPRPDQQYGSWASDFGTDEQALKDYRALVQELAARGVRIVYVTYPMYEPAYEPNKAAYDRYLAAMRKWMPPAPIIDFNEPQYSSFRADAANFIDAVHLSASGSAQFSDMLRIQVAQALSAK